MGTSPKDPGIIDSIKLGLGNTLGFLAIVLALGTMHEICPNIKIRINKMKFS
ncbi:MULTISPECIES: GntT/GntP/DsdX family permease [Bacillus]|uniref:GntT/GntP/DsdX family permease n=1 Tax=Bacillus TaxID=1386 RepID=UPI0035BE41CA